MVANLFHFFPSSKRYKENGMEIYGGFSPFISNSMSRGLCNYIEKDNVLLSSSGGIANDEATLMHCICQALEPKDSCDWQFIRVFDLVSFTDKPRIHNRCF